MRRLNLLPLLMALPLGAQANDPQPVFVEARLSRALEDLRTEVGPSMAGGSSVGMVLHSRETGRRSFSLGLRMDADRFRDRGTRKEAQTVGWGPEFTFYSRPGFEGYFLQFAFLYAHVSLTTRTDTGLLEKGHTRPSTTLAFGHRFEDGLSLSLGLASTTLDQDQKLTSLSLGIRVRM